MRHSGPGEAFAPAQRLTVRQLSALSRQRLDRRISDLDTLNAALAAWQHAINTGQRQVRRQLTTDDARVKLRHHVVNACGPGPDSCRSPNSGQGHTWNHQVVECC